VLLVICWPTARVRTAALIREPVTTREA
jgi:hypothetical protein